MITNVMLIASELLRVMSYSHRDTLIPIAILTVFTTVVSRFVLKIKEKQEMIITLVILVFSSAGLVSKYFEKVGPFSNTLDAFYFGYNFCLFDRIVVSRIPTSQYRTIYSISTMVVKFLLIPFNDKNLMVIHVVYIFAGIYLNFDKEKNDKNLFNSYFNSKNQLTKFKNLVVNDIPEGIVIIRQDLSQRLFANKSFTLLSNFGSNPDIRTHLSQFQVYEEEAKPQSQEKIISAKKTLLNFVESTILQPDFQTERKFSCNVTQNQKSNDSQGEYNNKYTLLEVKAFYIVWDEVPAVAVILHDITQQHTIISLKTANAQKDALLATVSHELRTPLNGMMGMIQILQKKTKDPEFIKYLNICKNSGSLLMGLVNSILDLNQIRAKKLKLNPEKVSLYGILNDMIQLFELQCFQKGIYLKLNIAQAAHKTLVTDPNRLSQIFINLIGNALKFTLKGGITISAKESTDGRYVQLSIEDTGIGIKDDDKHKLFKMFGKLEHSDCKTNQQGVGLGLTISDNLARLLCGEDNRGGITLASCYGKGSVFSFWIKSQLIEENQQSDDSLQKITADEGTDIDAKMRRYTMPQNNENTFHRMHTENLNMTDNRYVRRGINRLISSPLFKTVAYSALTEPCSSKADMHVLIVDDNPFNITVAEYLIKSYGYKVKTALYGQTAIDIMLNNNHYAEPIKVILMDCLMPIMDGYETTKILKKLMRDRKIPEVPIVALTANNSEADKEASKKAGMCGHLTKPLKEGDLFKILDKYAE